jgi:class 3 adenylate cyclase
MGPETRYVTTADGVHIAYQVVGDGPTDIVFVPGFVFNVEHVWEASWPEPAAFVRRLASFSRVILFDRRGTGLSDRIMKNTASLTLEARMGDIGAVMDATGSSRATLLTFEDGLALCAMFAATHRERTTALVSYGAFATAKWAPDYPWGWTEAQLSELYDDMRTRWGTVEFARYFAEFDWPSLDDEEWIAAYATWMRRSVSPGDAAELYRIDAETDIRELLPSILVPTLVIHRVDDRAESVEQARYIAERIPGSELVELPGDNHQWIAPDQHEVLDVIERFVLALREEEASFDRTLATVLFTDIVGSTEAAARLGDQAWRAAVERHHAIVRGLLARYRGTEIDTAGDGFFASFDGPARAVRCACGIAASVRELGLEIRAGVHTGEVEMIDDKIGGLTVTVGARIAGLAAPSEVLVSRTVKDLVAGSGLAFDDAGEHELKGVPDSWRLYRVSSP